MLKAIVREGGDQPEARFLLGSALLKTGDSSGAVIELGKAKDLGFPPQKVVPVLAAAMGASGQSAKIIEDFEGLSLNDRLADAELRAAIAAAYAANGQFAKAELVLGDALTLNPKNHSARMLSAQFAVAKNDYKGAISIIDGLIGDAPKSIEALTYQGIVHERGLRDPDAAAKSFVSALAVRADYVPAHVALIRLALAKQDVTLAEARLHALTKVAPTSIDTMYYRAYLHLLKGELGYARELVQRLLAMASQAPDVQYLAGLVEFRRGSILAAETHALRAVNLAPTSANARRLLTDIYLRAGKPDKAAASIKPALVEGVAAPRDWVLAAEAQVQLGNYAQADELYGTALKNDPAYVLAGTDRAMLHLRLGRDAVALERLEALTAQSGEISPDIALINVRMGRREFTQAMAAIDSLLKKQPKLTMPHLLKGRIFLALNDVPKARESFRQALTIDPSFFPAVMALGTIEVANGSSDLAEKLYRDYIANFPGNSRAFTVLADLLQRRRAKPEEVSTLLDSAIKASPLDPSYRVLLIEHYLGRNAYKAALSAAESAVAAMPPDPTLLDSLGRAHIASGNTQQAITAFRKLIAAQPNSVLARVRLAEAFLVVGDFESALPELRKAIELNPIDAKLMLVVGRLSTSKENGKRIVGLVQDFVDRNPAKPSYLLLKAEVAARRREWPQAIDSLTVALKMDRSSAVARRLHSVFRLAGRDADATRLEKQWLSAQPNDTGFLEYLGSEAMARNQYSLAEQLFRRALEIQPDNVLALNNVGWLVAAQGKRGGLKFADRANVLMPSQSWIMDTIAANHAVEGNYDQAVEWQRRAVKLAPKDYRYRFELARYLALGGKKAEARAELESLAALGKAIPWQDKVADGLKAL